MKKIVLLLVIGVFSSISLLPKKANAHGIGLDVVRLIDKNQDDGMFNIQGQIELAGNNAVTLGYSSGDNLTIVEGGFKVYFGRYLNSFFLQFGLGYYDHEAHGDDFGFIGSLGYSHSLARHLAVSGSTKVVAGVDESIIGYAETPVFQPTLSILLTF